MEVIAQLVAKLPEMEIDGVMSEEMEAISEGAAPEEEERAKELLEKLAEYKPLAKIEEMEEQNYNMMDNVLNNGAGEKAQREENRKAQELPVWEAEQRS